jgi:peptidoglycan/xylan/chitin deacetylase (PgdA/CDA1 family)
MFAILVWSVESQRYEGCKFPGEASLTFDDGPAADTPILLDYLKEQDIKATFFINCISCKNIPDPQGVVRRIHEEGHILGSHTYTHANLSAISNDEILFETMWLQEDLQKVLPNYTMRYLRPPFGEADARVEKTVHDLGIFLTAWNVDSNDWKVFESKNNPETEKRAFEGFKADVERIKTEGRLGIITLQHDTLSLTVNSTRQYVDILRTQGYKFVDLERCLGV